MPPARTILRNEDFTGQQLHSYKIHDIKGPYNSNDRLSNVKKTQYRDDYMDLDEFFQNTSSLDETTEDILKFKEVEQAKPNVDLLASLLTLGKMIQDQKQLIKQQQEHQEEQKEQEKQQLEQQHQEQLQQQQEEEKEKQEKQQRMQQQHEKDQNTQYEPIMPLSILDCDVSQLPSLSSSQSIDSSQFLSCMSSDFSLSSLKDRTIRSIANSISLSSGSGTYLTRSDDIDSMSQTSSSCKRFVVPEEIKDIDYWDRRKRNNLAAKKSREERRRKELEILEAAKQLERENSQLATMLKRLTARNELLETRLQDIRKKQLKSGSEDLEEEISVNSSSDGT